MKTLICLFILFLKFNAYACIIYNAANKPSTTKSDPLYELLQLTNTCPKDVIELRNLLKSEQAHFVTTMVANRGFHNPTRGSFSFFEMVEITNPIRLSHPVQKNELFFGHFTAPGTNNTLELDQNPLNSSLMIELIAWDEKNSVYNLYELIGSETGSTWFYRGSSEDIWNDTTKLHRTRTAEENVFGERLRCSCCHIAGGPIMKEIKEPHDSWWKSTRPLPLGGKTPDLFMQNVMQSLQDPNTLQEQTNSGINKLLAGKSFKNKQSQSPQIALRPLFCPEEINLETSFLPLDDPENKITVPTGFFLDERLEASSPMQLSTTKEFYKKALRKLNSTFPETNRIDGDHAWNAPVKANSDKISIEKLIEQGIIDEEFMTNILAIDMTRPVLSQKRCGLLKLLPNKWSTEWKENFEKNLAQSVLPEAKELLLNLTDGKSHKEFHKQRA